MKIWGVLSLTPAVLALTLAGCGEGDYFAEGSARGGETEKLFALFREEKTASETRFILIQRIAANLIAAGQNEKLNLFLTSYCEQEPKDPFNGYYLFLVAQNYKDSRASPLAVHYYERILHGYPDIELHGQSVHLQCLKELVRLIEKPEQRIIYHKELLSRFRTRIDEGAAFFAMATTYESLGEWDNAVQAYMNFLKYPDAAVSGYGDAHAQVLRLLTFHNSDKNWTRSNLDDLISAIKTAITDQNIRELNRLRAGVNFFAMSWDQEESSVNTQVMFDLGSFLRGSRVNYASRLDPDSNANEAYLETWGWSYRLPTWYLYFRKIRYPGDPEINGRWEWAGIYLGEKL